MPAMESEPTKAIVKWFNTTKGFGFVTRPEGGPDAFLHVSVLNRMGMQEVADGTELVCTVGQGPKGPQVMRIVEVLGIAEGFVPQPREQRGGFGGGDRGGFDRPRGPRRDFGGDRGGFGGGGFQGAQDVPDGPEIGGTVKWFKPDKGFGFVTADDGDKDVFVHKSALRRAGVLILEPGQRIRMRIGQSDKGREATWIAIE